MNGKCFCYENYTGSDCSISTIPCKNNCSNNGKCEAGKCLCNKNFVADDCSIKRMTCSNHGYFNETNYSCNCFKDYYGLNCENKKCPNDCSGNGECQKNGKCICKKDFYAYDCSKSKNNFILKQKY